MNKRIKAIILAFVISCSSLVATLSVPVSAVSDGTMTKIAAQYFNSCYSKLPSSIRLNDAADFVKDENTRNFSANGGQVPIPNTENNGSADASPTITCQEYFFGGGNDWSALINTQSYKNDDRIDGTKKFLEQLGYEAVVTKVKEEGAATITITYDNPLNRDASSNRIIAQSNNLVVTVFNENGKAYIENVETLGSPSSSTGVEIQVNYAGGTPEIRFVRGTDSVLDSITITDDMTYEDLVAAINASIEKLPSDIQSYYTQNSGSISYSEKDVPIGSDTIFQRKSMTAAMNNILGIKSDYGLTEAEIFNIYTDYLSDGKYVEMSCGWASDENPGGEWMKVRLKRDGVTDSSCYVRERQKTLYNGAPMSAGSTGYLFNQTNLTLADIVNRINAINPDDVEDAEDVDPNGGGGGAYKPTDPDSSNASDTEVNCFNAAGALGWILCPVIEFAQNTITAIYDSIVSNFLEFRAEFLNINGQGNSIYTAWQVFQSFANIVFVIVLLVVIFSQLTGIGIDNLGIKRVLPKLIIAAVLINLSYIICMLFVDISNILGVGLNNLFSGIIVSVGGASGSTGAAVLSTVVTGAVTGAVGALAVGTVGIWGGVVVIPLVLGLITTLIGVLFFFILLGARQAAIIMLVVVSPVAFACYMLPNTKTFFDKWLKIFEALLLLFPLCGLMMGGSAFASKVLMTLDTGFLGKLIAMLVGVVPFFFIPTLLRGAFSAMGNLGARISGFGQNMGRRITGAAANSDTVRDMNTRLRTGINRDGSLNALGRLRQDGAFTNWASRSRVPGVHRIGTMVQESNKRANARAQAARIKYMDEQQRMDKLNSPEFFEQYQTSQRMAFEKEQFNAAVDSINDETDKGENESALFARYDAAVASGNEFEAKAVAEIAGRRKDTANAFMQKFKSDSENGKYAGHEDIMRKVAKQMTTGDNSKNYRASNAMGFEYASSLVQRPNQTSTNYGAWKQNASNIQNALEHHVTNGKELYGQSNSSLRELASLSQQYGTDDSRQYLADLARRGEFEGYNTGGEYDETKKKSFEAIKGLATPLASVGDARPGEEFSTRGASTPEQPVTTRGNVSDQDLQRYRDVLQNKVNAGTATDQDRDMINRLDVELGERQNERLNK